MSSGAADMEKQRGLQPSDVDEQPLASSMECRELAYLIVFRYGFVVFPFRELFYNSEDIFKNYLCTYVGFYCMIGYTETARMMERQNAKMSKKNCCPNCGAPMTGEVCEYCGTRRKSGKTAAQPDAKTGRSVQKTRVALVTFIIVMVAVIAVPNIMGSIVGIITGAPDFSNGGPISADATRENPVPLGDTCVYCDSLYDYEVEVGVTEILRGSSAMDIVKASDRSPETPGQGKEYMLVKVKVKGLESASEEKIDLSCYDFECVSRSGSAYEYEYGLNLQPEIGGIYPGGETEGYLCYIIDVDDTPLIGFCGYDGTAWFATQ